MTFLSFSDEGGPTHALSPSGVGRDRVFNVGREVVDAGDTGRHGARATYISTGLLPLRLEAVNGGHADLRAGQIGSILSTHADSHGQYPVSLKPHFPFWWWVVLVLACFLPAFWTLAFGVHPERLPKHRTAGAEQ